MSDTLAHIEALAQNLPPDELGPAVLRVLERRKHPSYEAVAAYLDAVERAQDLDDDLEDFTLPNGRTLRVHRKEDCSGPCPIHNPSDHHMRDWPLHWRGDRGIFERICPEHGVGHPDSDTMAYIRAKHGEEVADVEGVHGCCGCCRNSPH